MKDTLDRLFWFIVGMFVGAVMLGLATDPKAQPVDPNGMSMLLLIDDDNDPTNGFDAWIGNPTRIRFDHTANFQYQLREPDERLVWQVTGSGIGTVTVNDQ